MSRREHYITLTTRHDRTHTSDARHRHTSKHDAYILVMHDTESSHKANAYTRCKKRVQGAPQAAWWLEHHSSITSIWGVSSMPFKVSIIHVSTVKASCRFQVWMQLSGAKTTRRPLRGAARPGAPVGVSLRHPGANSAPQPRPLAAAAGKTADLWAGCRVRAKCARLHNLCAV